MKDIDVIDRRSLTWPSWACDKTFLCRQIYLTLGSNASVDWEAGYAESPGYVEVVGSGERFRLLVFIRSAEPCGWQTTGRMLVPDDVGFWRSLLARASCRCSGSAKGTWASAWGLLWRLTQYELLTIEDMAAKTNSNGDSLLRFCETRNE